LHTHVMNLLDTAGNDLCFGNINSQYAFTSKSLPTQLEQNAFVLQLGHLCLLFIFMKMTNLRVGHFKTLIVQTLTQLPALEAADDHIFTDGGYCLKDQLLNSDRSITDVFLP